MLAVCFAVHLPLTLSLSHSLLLVFSFIIMIPVGRGGKWQLLPGSQRAANAARNKEAAAPTLLVGGVGLVFSLLSPFCLAWISIMLFIVVLSLSFPFAVLLAAAVGFQLMLFPATCISSSFFCGYVNKFSTSALQLHQCQLLLLFLQLHFTLCICLLGFFCTRFSNSLSPTPPRPCNDGKVCC